MNSLKTRACDIGRVSKVNIITKITRIAPLSITLVVLLLATPTAYGRGGGRGVGGHESGGHRGGERSSGMDQQGSEVSSKMHRRQHIQATKEQHSQYRNCVQSAERVRSRAREMTQAAKGKAFNREQAQQYREQLQNEIQMMEQNHQQFVEGLSEEQRAQIRGRVWKMDKARERLNAHLQTMDQELNQGEFNGKGVAKQAGEIEKAMKEWNKQYQKVASDLGV
jgi:uncharacterized phage infection (PIP) family protein YhgE